MAHSLNLIVALGITHGVFSLSLTPQSATAQTPRALIEKAIALRKSEKVLPRYTYLMLSRAQNRTAKGKLFLNITTLYEYTWIGDLPYGRVIEEQGKPLKSKALDLEQARYDQAVAGHGGLDVDVRAKIRHAYLVDTSLSLEPFLTPAYALRELRQETLVGNLTHVIDCAPILSADSNQPAATRHAIAWITDSGVILRTTYEIIADEPDRLHGSHGQEDFQLIDGNQLPQHNLFHLNAPNDNTGDFENTYSRFRRFNVSSRVLPVAESSGASVK